MPLQMPINYLTVNAIVAFHRAQMNLDLVSLHVYSTEGKIGLSKLLADFDRWLPRLKSPWEERSVKPLSLYEAFVAAISDMDRPSLTPSSLPLRPATRAIDGKVPVGLVSKLALILVESFTNGRTSEAVDALRLLAEAENTFPPGFQQGFRAALAEYLLGIKAYDEALEIANENLKLLTSCHYSQYLLYQILSKRGDSAIESRRIGLHDLSDRFCEHPFKTVTTYASEGERKGAVELYACNCASMLPYPFATWDSSSKNNINEYWNGEKIQEIRRSILDGDFSYCSRYVCPRILNAELPRRQDITEPALREIIDSRRVEIVDPPQLVLLAHDPSCNLACPSCRSEILVVRNDTRKTIDDFIESNITPLLQNPGTHILVSTDGDPIASKHYRKFLRNLDPKQHRGIGLTLQTNGLLLTPSEWESLRPIRSMIKGIGVSIDAAEPETYEDVRRPGKWSTIKENMEFLSKLRKSGELPYLYICFVVQKKNFMQMPDFVRLGQEWSVDRVVFGKLLPQVHRASSEWQEFETNAVTEENHPDHRAFLRVLEDPILHSPQVDMLNLASYLSIAGREMEAPSTDRARGCDAVSLAEVVDVAPSSNNGLKWFREITSRTLGLFSSARET